MPSDKPRLIAYTTQDTIDKLKIIAEEENRTLSKELEYIVLKFIKEYENKNGTINLQQINNEGTIHNIGNINTQNINTK